MDGKEKCSDHVSSRAHVYRPRTVKFTPSHFRNEWPGSRINARNILFYNPQSLGSGPANSKILVIADFASA